MPTAKAGAQCRVPVPNLLLAIRASEADGGKRGWWGQARPVGAGEANGGRKPPGQIHSQHRAFPGTKSLTTRPTG